MRGSFRRILWSTLIPLLTGCAPLRGGAEPSPRARLDTGLAAWRDGDLQHATLQLSQLASGTRNSAVREQARLFLVALELDPRNTSRDTGNAAALAAELISAPRVSASTERLGEVFYLLARDLGAAAPPDSSLLPRLPGTPLATRLDRLQAERDRQRAELQRLQQELKQKDEEIERLQRELERIRKTLRP